MKKDFFEKAVYFLNESANSLRDGNTILPEKKVWDDCGLEDEYNEIKKVAESLKDFENMFFKKGNRAPEAAEENKENKDDKVSEPTSDTEEAFFTNLLFKQAKSGNTILVPEFEMSNMYKIKNAVEKLYDQNDVVFKFTDNETSPNCEVVVSGSVFSDEDFVLIGINKVIW